MWRLIKTLLTGIAASFYFFPFEFTFLPGVNTKMAMAGVGLVLFIVDLAKKRVPKIKKDGFVLVVFATLVSLCGLVSVIYNGTNDYTYATYIVSMFVWLGGAYTAVKIMHLVHAYISIELVCNYLIGVSVAQCVIALLINWIPDFKSFVDIYVVGFDFVDLEMFSKANRLYGIGAGLDVAGTRFSVVLIMIAVLTRGISSSRYRSYIGVYLIAFVLISLVGNMIARTTTIGVLISIIYWLTSLFSKGVSLDANAVRIWKYLMMIMGIFIPIIIFLYEFDINFQNNIRFAFEGFFSMAEKGYWETNSNNILKNMIVFPDNFKTWVIGDGYIENPTGRDPYYVGPTYGGYYMGTDIGYLRFIFYFGLIGLSMFILYFYKVAKACMTRFPKYTTMFWLVLAINMIVWLKVSTDIFLVFAIFLCISKEENDAYEKQYEDSLPDPLDV